MAEKVGLDAKNLTNHSGRKRMIQKLDDEGAPYCQRTSCKYLAGRKNVQSLNNNSTLPERQQKIISNILNGYPGVPGPSGYQVGISSALTLNAIKTVQESATAPFNISVNALNESPTLFLHSPRSKKARHFVIESESD